MAKSDSGLAWALAAIGLAGAGFAAGLHRLVWSLLWVLTVLWIGFFLHMISSEHAACMELRHTLRGYHSDCDETIYWIIAFAAPIVVGIILRIVEGVVFAFFGAHKQKQDG